MWERERQLGLLEAPMEGVVYAPGGCRVDMWGRCEAHEGCFSVPRPRWFDVVSESWAQVGDYELVVRLEDHSPVWPQRVWWWRLRSEWGPDKAGGMAGFTALQAKAVAARGLSSELDASRVRVGMAA